MNQSPPFTPARPVTARDPAALKPRDDRSPPPEGPSFETIDRLSRATLARFTQGISPHAQFAAWFEWASHLARAPGRQMELVAACPERRRLGLPASCSTPPPRARPTRNPSPRPGDRRFEDQAWESFPFVFWQQAFLAQEEWWRSATRPIRGMTPKSAARVAFMGAAIARRRLAVQRSLAQSGDHRAHAARKAAPISRAALTQSSAGRAARHADGARASRRPLHASARKSPSRPARWCSATS